MNILDTISCIGAGIAIVLFLNFAARSLRPLPPMKQREPNLEPPRIQTDRERWQDAYGVVGLGEIVISYEETPPQNGRARATADGWQVLGRTYTTRDYGIRTLWDSDDYLTDGS